MWLNSINPLKHGSIGQDDNDSADDYDNDDDDYDNDDDYDDYDDDYDDYDGYLLKQGQEECAGSASSIAENFTITIMTMMTMVMMIKIITITLTIIIVSVLVIKLSTKAMVNVIIEIAQEVLNDIKRMNAISTAHSIHSFLMLLINVVIIVSRTNDKFT